MGILSAAYKYSNVAFGVFDARLNKPCDRTLNEKLLETEVELFSSRDLSGQHYVKTQLTMDIIRLLRSPYIAK